jgi:hypothetical protein
MAALTSSMSGIYELPYVDLAAESSTFTNTAHRGQTVVAEIRKRKLRQAKLKVLLGQHRRGVVK